MAYEDRLRTLKYISPKGTEFILQTPEAMQRSNNRKNSLWSPPDQDGTFVQDLGMRGQNIPLRIFFNGENFDLEIDTFFTALEERGIGKLFHPRYGQNISVVPLSFQQIENWKTEVNQGVIEVEFRKTVDIEFPQVKENVNEKISNEIDDFQIQSSEEFNPIIDNTLDQVEEEQQLNTFLNGTTNQLDPFAALNQDVLQQYEIIKTSLDDIDITDDVQGIASSFFNLIRVTSIVNDDINDLINSYENLFELFSPLNIFNNNLGANKLNNSRLLMSAILVTFAEASINATYKTKNEALNLVDKLSSNFLTYRQVMDDNEKNVDDFIQTGEIVQSLETIINDATAKLIDISFSLKQERIIILDRDRDIITLCFDLYKSTKEDILQFFIDTNNFQTDDFFILQKGSQIVYYV